MKCVEIISNIEIAPNVYTLKFVRSFEFQPGQVISLEVDNHAPRMYSIASGNNEEFVTILYDIKPEGEVTPLICLLKKGDKIKISDPFGNFICNDAKAYWIASGTGIVPFYSMFCSGLGAGKTLIHGGRTPYSFYFEEKFQPFYKDKYTRCLSNGITEGYFPGRLTTFLREQSFLPVDQNYYLCGSVEMIVEVRDLLIARHVPFNNIFAEIYF